MTAIFFLLCAFVFAFSILLIIDWVNRSEIAKFEIAKKKGREIFISNCKDVSIEDIFLKLNVSSKDREKVIKIIRLLQKTFDLKNMVPPSDFLLRRAMIVEIENPLDEDGKLNEYIEPYSGELVENLLLFLDKRKWKEKISMNEILPENEDDLIEAIVNMTVEEFVKFCLPLMK